MLPWCILGQAAVALLSTNWRERKARLLFYEDNNVFYDLQSANNYHCILHLSFFLLNAAVIRLSGSSNSTEY